MPWEVLYLPIVTIWHSKFGVGVGKERFGLVLAIFLVPPMLMLTLNLEKLTVLLSGLYTQIVFADINTLWGPFCVDLFASRLNFKVSTYASWKPDPGAK